MSRNHTRKPAATALALSLALALGACGGVSENRTLYSQKQPVVERTNFTLDLATEQDGLAIPEQQRLAEWFETIDLKYGDRVSIDDPVMSAATRDAVSRFAGRHGILLTEGAPTTVGYITPGRARVVVTRSTASVPGCPDWSAKSDINYNNAMHSNYGCAINSNLAAMVANPEDLIKGQEGTGETIVATSSKAIDTYRDMPPTGADGLAEVSASEGK